MLVASECLFACILIESIYEGMTCQTQPVPGEGAADSTVVCLPVRRQRKAESGFGRVTGEGEQNALRHEPKSALQCCNLNVTAVSVISVTTMTVWLPGSNSMGFRESEESKAVHYSRERSASIVMVLANLSDEWRSLMVQRWPVLDASVLLVLCLLYGTYEVLR